MIDRVPGEIPDEWKAKPIVSPTERELITEVPGMPPVADVARGVVGEEGENTAPLGSRENPVVVSGGPPDPSHVLGHPSNQSSMMMQAMADKITGRSADMAQGQGNLVNMDGSIDPSIADMPSKPEVPFGSDAPK